MKLYKIAFNSDLLLIIIAIFFASIKFFNINLTPIFLDEAIFLSFAEKITFGLHNIFISLHGTQLPIMFWILALINIASHSFINLLTSGRVLSISCDILSAYFLYILGKRILNKKGALIAPIIYLSLPLTFFHSRFVLLESMTNLFSILAIYFVINSLEERRKGYIWQSKQFLGVTMFIILAFFTKPLAVVSLIPIILIPLFFALKDNSLNLDTSMFFYFSKKIFFQILLSLVIIVIVFIPLTNQFSSAYLTTSQPSINFLSSFKFNLEKVWLWIQVYITSPILLITGISISINVISRKWKSIWLTSWLIIVVILDSWFGKHFYPRHLYPMAAPLSLLVADIFSKSVRFYRYLPLILLFFTLILPWKINFQLLTKPSSVLVGEDRQQFYEDWTSGVGLFEVAHQLSILSQNRQIIVYSDDGELTAWALSHLYQIGNTIIYVSNDLGLNKDKFYSQLIKNKGNEEVYVLLSHYLDIPNNWKVKLIYSFPKGGNQSINIYKFPGN